jgi:hypothetical protein
MHELAEGHETYSRATPGAGDCTVQVLPARRSTSCPWTAVHTVAELHDTLLSDVSPLGVGVVCCAHAASA